MWAGPFTDLSVTALSTLQMTLLIHAGDTGPSTGPPVAQVLS